MSRNRKNKDSLKLKLNNKPKIISKIEESNKIYFNKEEIIKEKVVNELSKISDSERNSRLIKEYREYTDVGIFNFDKEDETEF